MAKTSMSKRVSKPAVDGQWRDHPDAPRRVSNPFGGENCVLTVS